MRKVIYAILIVVALLLLCSLAVWFLYKRLAQQPQGTPLSMEPSTLAPVATLTLKPTEPALKVTETPKPALVPTSQPVLAATSTAPGIACGGSGLLNILVLGRSIHLPAGNFRADLVRLVRLDFDRLQASVYALPGELVVDTPKMVSLYQTQNARLGDIFTIVEKKDGVSAESDYRATQAIAQAILDNFGVAADHYIVIKEDIVMKVIDTMGGIELDLPQQFTMPEASAFKGMVLQPGKYLFNGEMTHTYMTFRTGTADEWGRFNRQDVILDGMRQKIMDPAVFLKIPELFKLYKENIVTDLSLEQIGFTACLAQKAGSQAISFASLPQDKVSVGTDGSIRLLDSAAVASQMQAIFGTP